MRANQVMNYIELLGKYCGESELDVAISAWNIQDRPKLPRNERSVIVVVPTHGIELTFTGERFLDISSRSYPDGALVLSNIFFHGEKNDDHEAFESELPNGLHFSMSKDNVIDLLGEPHWTNPMKTLFRWDSEGYCVSSRFDASGRVELVGVQLPNKYTLRKN